MKRSVYSKIWLRIAACGYLFCLSVLKCLYTIPQNIINGVVIVGSILLVVFAIYSAVVPLECEDEMVLALYARANNLSDAITQSGLMVVIILLCAKNYNREIVVSSAVLISLLSGLMLLVAIIRAISVFYNSKRGI